MKSLVMPLVCVLITVVMAEGQDPEPKSSPTPGPLSGETDEPALPAPDVTPGNAGPALLPESDALPANPNAEQSMRAAVNRASTKPAAKEGARFDEIQSLAMSNPRAVYLLKRARNSSSIAARRAYLRAYYSAVAARMRKLDPELKSSIDDYEEAKIHQIAGFANSSSGSSHRSRSHRTVVRAPRHRSRRITAHHRYDRMMIIYDPYGPYMPSYGPPVVFEPW
jgi:hypothetical protein